MKTSRSHSTQTSLEGDALREVKKERAMPLANRWHSTCKGEPVAITLITLCILSGLFFILMSDHNLHILLSLIDFTKVTQYSARVCRPK